MTDKAIKAHHLRKTYDTSSGPVEAVQDMNIEVPEGSFFGILGPNGAGKSTTMGMLTTLVRPSGGLVEVAGYDATEDPVAVKQHIGVVSQNNTLDRKLTVVENLEFRGRYLGLDPVAARARADDVLRLLELTHRRDARVSELSGGQARRLMAGRALMNRPEILFLDEPTAGVDPQARANMWEIFRYLNDEGMTIVLTTHNLEEAEQLCDEMAIVDHGRELACDGLEGLTQKAGAETVLDVVFDGDAPPACDTLLARPEVKHIERAGPHVQLMVDRPDGLVAELIAKGASEGHGVVDVTTTAPSLETVFLNLTGREYR